MHTRRGMQSLRVIGVHDDGEHLLLGGIDGEIFRLRIDDSLRSTISRKPQQPAAEAAISGGNGKKPSPRDIQLQIRSGITAEEIADTTGASLEYIRRYEGPVLDERQYIVDQAQLVQVADAIPGSDGYHSALNDNPANLLEMVRYRLSNFGINNSSLEWDAWLRPDGSWTIVANFDTSGVESPNIGDMPPAQWAFHARRKTLQNLNRWAQLLSEIEPLESLVPSRRLSAVKDSPFNLEDHPSNGSRRGSHTSGAAPTNDPLPEGLFDSPPTSTPSPSPQAPTHQAPTHQAPGTRGSDSTPVNSTPAAPLSTGAGANSRMPGAINVPPSPTSPPMDSTPVIDETPQQPTEPEAEAVDGTENLLDILSQRRGQRLGADFEEDDAFAEMLTDQHDPEDDYDAPVMQPQLSLAPPLEDPVMEDPNPETTLLHPSQLSMIDPVKPLHEEPPTLLDPPPSRRAKPQQQTPEPPRAEPAKPEAAKPEPETQALNFSEESAEPANTKPSASKTKRSSVPSWDEIVFGTKGD